MENYEREIIELERIIDGKIANLQNLLYELSRSQETNAAYLETLKKNVADINAIIGDYKTLKVELKALKEDVNELKEARTWLFRIIIGIIITAGVELILKAHTYIELLKKP